MVRTHLLRFFIPMATMAATLFATCPADAEVVALRRGAGTFGLFQNGQISPVFRDKLPDATGNGSNTITEITDASAGVNIVDDAKFWGGSDVDSSGIPTPRGGGNTWDEPRPWFQNFGTSGSTDQNELSLLKFDVAQATGLIGGTVNKAELRLFFDDGFGPDPDDVGVRDLSDGVGRITSYDWVEGNKDDLFPGFDDTANGGPLPAPGVVRAHPNSSITGGHRDINDQGDRTRGRWFDPDDSVSLLGSDYDGSGLVDGEDLNRWKDNFGSATPPATGMQWKFPLGDDDLNGAVTGSDFLAWQGNNAKVGVDNGERGWFNAINPATDVTFQAPTWGDGNDYFNPDAVDYTSNPDFPKMTVDGVDIYAPFNTGGDDATFPVSPNDGVSPGDGDVANEVNSIDDTSLFPENFDFEFGESEAGFLGGNAGFDVWDLTALIQSIADGADNFGFYIRDNLRTFALSETINGLDFAPVLFIDYTPAAAATSVPEPSSNLLMGIVLLGLMGFAGFPRRNRLRVCWAKVPTE